MKKATFDQIGNTLGDSNYVKFKHEPYSYVSQNVGDRLSEALFIERMMDITAGAALCMGLVVASADVRTRIVEGDEDPDLVPVLSSRETDFAARFAIAALRNLADDSLEKLLRINKEADEAAEGQTKQRGRHD